MWLQKLFSSPHFITTWSKKHVATFSQYHVVAKTVSAISCSQKRFTSPFFTTKSQKKSFNPLYLNYNKSLGLSILDSTPLFGYFENLGVQCNKQCVITNNTINV
jgi:hypothetical protein